MTWNYRVIRHRERKHGIDHTWYGLHEVYYRKNGKMYLWAPEPEVIGDSVQDLVGALASMLRDATKASVPVLNKREMPGENRKKATSRES